MKRPALSMVFYLCLVFLSGILVGSIGFGLYQRSVSAKAPTHEELLRRWRNDLHTRLNLRPDQIAQVDAILDATHERFRQLREKYRPEVRAIQAEQSQRLSSVLDERQRAEYEKIRAERERHHQQDQQRKSRQGW